MKLRDSIGDGVTYLACSYASFAAFLGSSRRIPEHNTWLLLMADAIFPFLIALIEEVLDVCSFS